MSCVCVCFVLGFFGARFFAINVTLLRATYSVLVMKRLLTYNTHTHTERDQYAFVEYLMIIIIKKKRTCSGGGA